MTGTTQASVGRWCLATSSYKGFKPEMGVAVRTSVGPHPAYRSNTPFLGLLAPYGIFQKMDDDPVDEQRAAYMDRLNRNADRIAVRLDEMTGRFPAQRLVLLCWCHGTAEYVADCHRRWAAAWLIARHHVDVPELDT